MQRANQIKFQSVFSKMSFWVLCYPLLSTLAHPNCTALRCVRLWRDLSNFLCSTHTRPLSFSTDGVLIVILRLLLLFKHFLDFAVFCTPYQSICSVFLTRVYFILFLLHSFLPTLASILQSCQHTGILANGYLWLWLRLVTHF